MIAIARVYRDALELGRGPQNMLTYGSYDLSLEPDVTKRRRLLRMGRLVGGKLEDFDPARITEEVRRSWYKCQALADSRTNPNEQRSVHALWARIALEEGKYDDALAHFDQADQEDPYNWY